MAQSSTVLDAAELAKLLNTLHGAGYRLRKLGADSLEVVDTAQTEPAAHAEPEGPKLTLAQQEELDAEQDKWAHVGGKPPGLRELPRLPTAGSKSPWAVSSRDDS